MALGGPSSGTPIELLRGGRRGGMIGGGAPPVVVAEGRLLRLPLGVWLRVTGVVRGPKPAAPRLGGREVEADMRPVVVGDARSIVVVVTPIESRRGPGRREGELAPDRGPTVDAART